MPCYYTGSKEGDLQLSLQESHEATTKLARMLCTAMEHIEQTGCGLPIDVELTNWWASHKQLDADRAVRDLEQAHLENLRSTAMSKLTPTERKALGL